jgi:hypothetical protein
MADTFVGGSYTFDSDDVGGKHYARIKLIHGADGVNAGDVALANPLPSTPIGVATNGLDTFRSLDLDESEEQVKATAGTVYGMWVTNTATATRFVKFYDATAASVTVGTTTPMITVGVPGNTGDDVAGAFNVGGLGILFATAISVAATTGRADNDTGAPDAGDITVNVFFK